jgi:diguanylate cyclase (GGDEF)-like protein
MGTDGWRFRGRTAAAATAAALVAVVLLGALAVVIGRSDAEARRALEDEQAGRADVAAAFVRAYVADVHARADVVAEELGGELPAAALADAVFRLGSKTAAVLDERGRVLANHPSDPGQIGTDVTTGAPHLKLALAGTPAVSGVQDSRLVDVPIIAFAVPFDGGDGGRRVLTAGFPFDDTPIGRFFAEAVTSEEREVVLVDDTGAVVAADHTLADRTDLVDEDPPLAAAVDSASRGTYERDGEERWFVSQTVEGTPWTVVTSLPTSDLYAPVGDLRWIGRALFAAVATTALVVALLVVRLVRTTGRYERLARIDQLTGVPNRRHLQEALERTAAAGRRHQRPVAVLLIDVDHFKAVNDTHGHKAGDRVLVTMAGELSAAVRTADLVGRWGGEEFLAVLPDTDADAATTVAERVRERVAALTWPWADLQVTVSVGVGAGTRAPDQLVLRADAALYAGKARGRDRVELVDHPLAPELVAERPGAIDLRAGAGSGDLDLDRPSVRPHGGRASS